VKGEELTSRHRVWSALLALSCAQARHGEFANHARQVGPDSEAEAVETISSGCGVVFEPSVILRTSRLCLGRTVRCFRSPRSSSNVESVASHCRTVPCIPLTSRFDSDGRLVHTSRSRLSSTTRKVGEKVLEKTEWVEDIVFRSTHPDANRLSCTLARNGRSTC